MEEVSALEISEVRNVIGLLALIGSKKKVLPTKGKKKKKKNKEKKKKKRKREEKEEKKAREGKQ